MNKDKFIIGLTSFRKAIVKQLVFYESFFNCELMPSAPFRSLEQKVVF